MIKILLADDETLLRSSLARILDYDEELQVVAQANNGQEAIQLFKEVQPDVTILDIEMPTMDGLVAAQEILADGPAKIIFLTRHARPGLLKAALDIGVSGFATKTTTEASLPFIIKQINQGITYIDPIIIKSALKAQNSPLTKDETEILKLLKEGLDTLQISEKIYLTQGTIRNKISAILVKLSVKTRQEAIKKAWGEGWI